MRKLLWFSGLRRLILAGLIALGALPALAAAEIQVGSKVPGFSLTDSSGGTHTLAGYSGKVLALAFWSFKCPVSLAYDERLEQLQDKYRNRGVIVLAVACNANETEEQVRRNVAHLGLSVPVLLDQEGVLATMLGASHTPSIFVLDGGGTLRYRGALDNNKRIDERGREAYADQALQEILAGQQVSTPRTESFGCSIRMRPF